MTDPTSTPTSGPDSGSGGMSIAAMVLGIAAVIFAFIPFIPLLPYALAVGAIVLGFLGRKRAGRTMATAGIWLGVGAIILTTLMTFLILGWMMG